MNPLQMGQALSQSLDLMLIELRRINQNLEVLRQQNAFIWEKLLKEEEENAVSEMPKV